MKRMLMFLIMLLMLMGWQMTSEAGEMYRYVTWRDSLADTTGVQYLPSTSGKSVRSAEVWMMSYYRDPNGGVDTTITIQPQAHLGGIWFDFDTVISISDSSTHFQYVYVDSSCTTCVFTPSTVRLKVTQTGAVGLRDKIYVDLVGMRAQ